MALVLVVVLVLVSRYPLASVAEDEHEAGPAFAERLPGFRLPLVIGRFRR